ncbi:hypothetical protein OX284_014515 [Flavobacterium sp. SUN046]|uniref:hypothetical protein n=1 Tax=Flavobacterium sp. SUN046 TaxID=3002440 RepID=UPI002DB5B68C|nr:hypothetical protein [Flavobacterium sp. SUN046]MEC4050649.1 hypothetical protein [Flavobacterium sp. SUN046]
MKKIRCMLGYRNYGNGKLINLCTKVSNGIYNDSDRFSTPVVPQAEFNTALHNYTDSVGRFENAPKIERSSMEQARNVMIGILDRLRVYVDFLANGDESLINLSGFDPTKGTINKTTPLVLVDSFEARRTPNLGEVEVEIHKDTAVEIAWYFVICSKFSNLTSDTIENGLLDIQDSHIGMVINFNNGRIKKFTKLSTGVMYYFYVFAVNSVSVSALSNPRGVQL